MSDKNASPRDDMPRNGERVFYVRDLRHQPVACLAWARNGEVVEFGSSFLHPNDKFDRRRARQIALGRLRVNPDFQPINDGEAPLATVLTVMSKDLGTPSRVRKIIAANIELREQVQRWKEFMDLTAATVEGDATGG